MSKREWAEGYLEELNPEALFLDGYDEAIIGITDSQVVYSERAIIDTLVSEGCSEEDAWDHYGFNILGSIQDQTDYPLIIRAVEED